MSRNVLDPNAPHPHIWPMWGSAVRAWHAGRKGRRPSKSATGNEPRGKGPTLDDLLRVGRALRGLQLLDDHHELNDHGKVILDVALGLAPRCGTQGTKTLVQRVERQLRRLGIVRPASPRSAMARWRFTRADGSTASHAYLDDSR